MNNPAGFDWVNGRAGNVDPFRAMFNPGWVARALHMTLGMALIGGTFPAAYLPM